MCSVSLKILIKKKRVKIHKRKCLLRSFGGSEHSILGNNKEEVKMALEATELGPMDNPSSCRVEGLKETSTEKQRGAERKMKGG